MSQISLMMFFSSEKELFSRTDPLKETLWRIKILIFPVWNKILKIWDKFFELMQIEVQCNKNHFKIFFTTWSWSSFKWHRKGIVKATPKIEKIYILIFYREYLFCLQSSANGSFLQTRIDFVEQWVKFSNFDGSITA